MIIIRQTRITKQNKEKPRNHRSERTGKTFRFINIAHISNLDEPPRYGSGKELAHNIKHTFIDTISTHTHTHIHPYGNASH